MKAILLDLGGVVIDVDPQRCFDHWAAAAGVDARRIRERWRADRSYEALEVGAIRFPEYIDNLSVRLGIALGPDDWRDGWNALLGEAIGPVVEMLPSLAARVPLYCFSNTNAVHQAAWERRFEDALRPFRRIYTSWELGHRKPDVAAYQRVADAIGVAPRDILFLDDNAENVRGAAAAGLDAHHVPRPADAVAVLRRAGFNG